MNFLIWYKPWTWGEDIGNAVTNAFDSLEGLLMRGIRQLFFLLNSLLYDLIIKLYNMFETLCSARLLNASVVNAIATRIGMILGIVMLFNVVLAFINMLIDPDKVSDKNNGAVAVIKRVLIVIVMLGVSNFVFDTLYYVQYSVINSGAISKILLPKIPKYEDGSDISNFGGLLAEETFSAFYYVDPALVPVSGDDGEEGREKLEYCEKAVEKFRSDLVQDVPNFDMGNVCLNEYVTVQTGEDSENESEEFVINFNFLLLTAAGIGIAYFIFMYCIKVGIRMIQLMILEIIAPMAFISYLSPKQDNMFSKWYKIYLATYIDVFIRVAIINLVTMIISAMFTTEGGLDGFVFWKDLNVDIGQRSFYIIVMILALLAFAKKAPELLKELMPASASKLGFGEDSLGGGLIGGLVGGTLGGAFSGIKNEQGFGNKAIGFLQGGLGGALHGGLAGLKDNKGGLSGLKAGGKSGSAAAAATAQRVRLGGSRVVTPFSGNYASRIDDQNEKLQKTVDMYNSAQDEAKSEAQKNGQNYYIDSATYGNKVNMRQLDALRNDQNISAEERAKYAEEYDRLEKAATMFNLDAGAAAENGQIYFAANGQYDHASYTDSNGNPINVDRTDMAGMNEHILGSENAKIEENIRTVSGQSRGTVGRGNTAKTKRNEASSQIVRNTSNNKYQRSKANQKKK